MDLETNAPVSSAGTTTPLTSEPSRPPVKGSSRWVVWLIVIVLLVGLGLWYIHGHSKAAPGSSAASTQGAGHHGRNGGAIPVATATVKKGNMGEYINALGTVTSVYTVTVTSRVAGALVTVNYREGQTVHKGDLLAEIDPRPYQATALQAEGQLERDQATLANARIDLDRYKQAFAQHAIPEQTLATQKSTVNQNEGTVKVDQGNLDAAKVNVDYTKITSPIDGRVGLRMVDPGNIVAANGTTGLLTITQLQPITIIFTMAENYISDVVTEMQKGHKLRVEAFSHDNETELAQGTLLTIDNLVDTTTATVKARATFQNRDYKLFPNEFVNVKLLVKTLMGVNIVPNAAIQRNNDVAYVYVLGQNNVVKSANITVASTDGDQSAVTGVKPGDVVVTDGFDKLQDGTKVVVRKPGAGVGAGASNTPSESEEDTQPPEQGNADKTINTAQQNPQPQKKGTSK